MLTSLRADSVLWCTAAGLWWGAGMWSLASEAPNKGHASANVIPRYHPHRATDESFLQGH